MKKAIAVMKKDFSEIKRNFQVFGVMIILPIIFGVFYPVLLFFILPAVIAEEPATAGFLISMFSSFFLLMSVTIPAVVASDSFAGEKERKTIEALLAAPISDSELFLGKVLVSFIPAVVLTYISATIYCILVDIAVYNLLGYIILPDAAFLFQMGLVPLFALLGIELTVFVSVRVKGFREAQQISGLIIIPVLGIVIVNAFGISVFVFPWNWILIIGTGLADIGLYSLAVKKFGRENIVSKI
ncbi:MAG: ABC transporter permease subunit [Candidatus Helarchaeota archaeon]